MSIFLMRALRCVLSVTMPICGPVKLTAFSPSSWIAMRGQRDARSARRWRGACPSRGPTALAVISAALAMRSSVVLPWARQTTMTWLPACLARMALRAASMIALRVLHTRPAELLHHEAHGVYSRVVDT